MEQEKFSKVIDLQRIQVTDAFWKKEIELVRDTVIPYQWEALNDRIPDTQPSYCMHNFKVAGRINQQKEQKPDYVQPVYTTNGFCVWPEDPEKPEEKFYGFVFQDSDFAKWIEAVGYILQQFPDPELQKTADEAIDIVCSAQQPDGYLDTFYIINDISKRFTNLRDHHELYCLGHLVEGAVSYYQATGKKKLLDAACRYAECVAEHIGPEAGKLQGYPGHEIAEMALARLYEVTGQEKYRDLGLYFINERGKQPYYFDREFPPTGQKSEELRYHYHQAHLPVREQSEAAGHAVRAAYLYSGMADFARLTSDDELKAACERIWEDITQKKMYITGGVGGTHIGEAFSFAYDLPNDTAYAETCASIGMIFFARRMLEMSPDSKYANVMERELYNIVLGGMDLDGTGFFYVNPLEVVPEACHKDERKAHVKPVRQKWFGCACCPPNLARLISSIGSYVFTETENTVFVHLYIGSRMEKKTKSGSAKISIRSGFPWDGNVTVQVAYDCIAGEKEETFTIALRIPDWCSEYQIKGIEGAVTKEENGYLYITKAWKSDSIQIEFPMEIKIIESDSRVRENIGKAAVMRGPVVYCLEEADNGKDLHLLKMDENAVFETEQREISSEPVIAIKANGWRQQAVQHTELYTVHTKAEYDQTCLTWIPYYTWANRGEGEMQVWTRI
ncbi:MAG: glycoside hydrolase family 127 protein [Lachnospiraceae bacterium]|nr:glycoside hydrolase family 127 protein [Lachnospiraceae bacterium]